MRTDKGMVVNLYLVKKMLGAESVMHVKAMLDESYRSDRRYYRECRNMTFEEYVNYKRSFVADIMGCREYI